MSDVSQKDSHDHEKRYLRFSWMLLFLLELLQAQRWVRYRAFEFAYTSKLLYSDGIVLYGTVSARVYSVEEVSLVIRRRFKLQRKNVIGSKRGFTEGLPSSSIACPTDISRSRVAPRPELAG